MDQLRADVFGDILIDGVTDLLPAGVRGIRPTVVVTVPALALLPDGERGGEPATVEGVGPIPIGRARELCGAAKSWMRVLTHPETGMVLSVARTHYRPPPELRRLVRWRAETCMAPGCGIPATRCQIDHNIAWEHGGHTALHNLAPHSEPQSRPARWAGAGVLRGAEAMRSARRVHGAPERVRRPVRVVIWRHRECRGAASVCTRHDSYRTQ